MAHSKTKRTAAAALTILIMALALAWQGDKSPPPPATAPPAETPVPPRETARNLTATADLAIGQPDAGTSLPPATSGGNPLVDLPSVQAPRRPAAAPDFSTPNGEEAAFGLEATQGQAGYAKETIPFTWLAFSHLHEISISHTEDEWQRGVVAGNSAGGTAGPEHDDAVTTATGESTPQQPAPDWTTVGVQGHSGQAGFSLMLPPGWNFTKLKGRDSYVAQITGESVNLLLDYGWYSWDLDLKTRPDPGREYVELREYIGGLPAKVLLSKDPSGGHTGVYIENFGNPMDGLLILGWGLTPEQQDTALTIFPSIRVITPPPQPTAAPIPSSSHTGNSKCHQRASPKSRNFVERTDDSCTEGASAGGRRQQDRQLLQPQPGYGGRGTSSIAHPLPQPRGATRLPPPAQPVPSPGGEQSPVPVGAPAPLPARQQHQRLLKHQRSTP